MVLAEPGLARASGAGPASRWRGWILPAAAAACALSLAAYLAEMAWHPGPMLNWYDLNVYDHAGLIVRSLPRQLYAWQLQPGIKFTYTPFAAVLFAVCSLLPWAMLRWLMTLASLAALTGTVWFTLGALGWRGRARAAALLALTAVALWIEPVQRALHLGQIELLLMALIVWDLCQSDGRRWKGAGVGLAAGIKLVPLIFIPYLLLAGKRRQAAVAAAVFAGTVVIGFAALPHASAQWWLTGYFLHAGNVGDVGSLLNQSLFGLVTRAAGSVRAATVVWLGLAAAVTALGLAAAAALHRSGRTVRWLADLRADRAAGLADQLGSPLGMDRAGPGGARGRGGARPRRRPLGVRGAGRGGRGAVRCLAGSLGRPGRADPAGPARVVHRPASRAPEVSPVRPAGDQLESVRAGRPGVVRAGGGGGGAGPARPR